jgi:uncharacterized protein (TIGR03086 family)
MEGNEQLTVIVPMLKRVASSINDEQLDRPTPCADFSVAGVLEHMTTLATAFAPMFRGDSGHRPGAVPSTATQQAAFVDAVDELLAAVQSPGALTRTVRTPGGDMPGAVFARLVALDGLVHGWDLATSTDQEWRPPADLLADVDDFARQTITDDVRAGGSFAPARQPARGDDVMLGLAAFTGRST